jgi:hypothetical protein
MVFDVKYDLRYKARLVSGVKWTVIEKEDIYSGILRWKNCIFLRRVIRIFLLCMPNSDIGNTVLYGKTKEKVYINSDPEFVEDLREKNLIINKSLYGLKTSTARFHEHLVESFLRLGFEKTKHDPDL